MKKAVLAFAALATVATGFATPSLADSSGLRVQVQYYDNNDGYRPRPPRPDAPPPPPGYGRPDRRPDWGNRDTLRPRDVTRMLERRGYAVGDMRRDRDTYMVRATRPNGRRVIVMVDAFSGRIVGERRPGGY
ncbi:PepSY domain-containing protein [Brucella haematophila]|uniref:PepSY domain-containing protein n=1 Tax=Brucella haematophila TaxID=419474 RepID=UPI00110F42FE|nr:PepSY domain-containing protein [Brucella haematophila]TMV05958.1 antifreeze protein [Brucella haematophila]